MTRLDPFPLVARDEVEEDALVVEVQVRQIVGEICKVVPDAGLHVLADVTIDRGERAAATLIRIR